MPYHRLSDGTPLYYEEHGPKSGRTIVFIPGWTFTVGVWRRQFEALADTHRIISFDLRGAGRSGKTAPFHSLAEYAEDAAELLATLNVRDATVVGWALGASVAAYLASGPGAAMVGRLVWIDHSPCFFAVPDWPYALYGNLTPITLAGTVSRLHVDRPAVTSGLLNDIFSRGIADEDRARFYDECFQTPTDIAGHMLLLVGQADLRPLLPALSCPMLVVNGRDSIVPHGVGAWMASILPRARNLVLDEAAHAPFWDQAAAFNDALRSFVAAA